MTSSRAFLAQTSEPFWFCLKAQPKREHLGAAGLRKQLQIPCFAPRLRYRKLTRRGTVWFVEAMFPSYLFAQFVYAESHRRVEHSPGIQGIVHFGDHLATLDVASIAALKNNAGEDEIVTVTPDLQVGETVRIAEGPLQGIEALVTNLLPANERIRILFTFLGRSVETETTAPKLLPTRHPLADPRSGRTC